MKDNDDYELASDDEVNDVITDGKVKIYKKNKQAASVVNVAQSNPISLPQLNNNLSNSSNNNNIIVPVLQSNKSK